MKKFDSIWKIYISGNFPKELSYSSVFQETKGDVLQGIIMVLQKSPAGMLEKASA